MPNNWQEYVNDPKIICKYGSKCYQKNPEHHSKYKHPPISHRLKNKRDSTRFNPYKRNAAASKTDDYAEASNENSSEINNQHQPINEIVDTPIVETNSSSLSNTIPSTNNIDKQDTTHKPELNKLTDVSYYDPTRHELIQELFLIEMPSDFYKFYECMNDENVEKILSSVNLELIGPYDLLRGKLPIVDNKELYFVHWRFFYDPPEFQAVLKRKGKSEFHMGYFRDVPDEKPVFVASNDSSKDYHIKPVAENIFGAVYIYLQNEKKSSPFVSVACQKLMDKVKKYAEQNNISLEQYSMKQRQAKMVTKSFHGAGIVVPYNKKSQLGYRPLVENDATIKKIFTKLQAAESQSEKDKILSELQPVITYASIALDECDFGTGIEAGLALFCSGLKELETSALSSLSAAYNLLNRGAFSKIIQAHMKYRRKGSKLSLLEILTK